VLAALHLLDGLDDWTSPKVDDSAIRQINQQNQIRKQSASMDNNSPPILLGKVDTTNMVNY
jgi:hypothetical protein